MARPQEGSTEAARTFTQERAGQNAETYNIKLSARPRVDDDDEAIPVKDLPEYGAFVDFQRIFHIETARRIDGMQLGGGGMLYPAQEDHLSLPPAVSNRRAVDGDHYPTDRLFPQKTVSITYGNGMLDSAQAQHQTIKNIANALSTHDSEGPPGTHREAEVRGVHNFSGGFFRDLYQSTLDKLEFGDNHAVATKRDAILDIILAGRPFNAICHSQDGVIMARALMEVRVALQEGLGMSRKDAVELLSETVSIVTCGAAAYHYPTGPHYVHLVNSGEKKHVPDPVPMTFGLGVHEDVQQTWKTSLGRRIAQAMYHARNIVPVLHERNSSYWYKGAPADEELHTVPERSRARIIEISDEKPKTALDAHGMNEVYLKYIEANRRFFMDEVFRPSYDVLEPEQIEKWDLGAA
ncbi:MAG: hypothetical protein AAF654_11490 [Myxococcota bacterium]